MSKLVKIALRNCAEKTLVGEIQMKQAFDKLKTINLGHDNVI